MSTPTDKEFSTVQAAFALKGHRLIKCENTRASDYLVILWGCMKPCKDWPAVLAFLDQIGGRA